MWTWSSLLSSWFSGPHSDVRSVEPSLKVSSLVEEASGCLICHKDAVGEPPLSYGSISLRVDAQRSYSGVLG